MSGSAASYAHASPPGRAFRMHGDDRLARLAAQGSERAFALIYERHYQALFRYCRSIVRDEHDAQDVSQTVMAKALAALRKGPPAAPLRPWLFRIAHNESISLLRSRRPTAELDEAEPFTGPSVESSAEERARLALLVADLGELPERQRSALVMRELSGLSHAEIATALGLSPAGAKQAILDARIGLAEFAKGREMQCSEAQRLISDSDGRTLRGRQVRAHLRACGDCRALRDAIARRRNDLAAIAPPLPAAVATGFLTHLLGGGGAHAGGGGLAAAATATTGKAVTAGLAAKLATGGVVLATVGVGAPKLVERESPPPKPAPAHTAPAAGQTGSPTPAPAPGARPTTSAPAKPRGAKRSRSRGSSAAAGARGPKRASRGRPASQRRRPAKGRAVPRAPSARRGAKAPSRAATPKRRAVRRPPRRPRPVRNPAVTPAAGARSALPPEAPVTRPQKKTEAETSVITVYGG